MKKILLTIVNILATAVIVLAVYMLLMVVLTPRGEVPSMFGHTVFRTLTGSMAPEIPRDSMIVVKKTDPDEIQVGDVITFYSDDPELDGAVNTHRVTQIQQTDSGLVFTTKGDANALEDRYPVTQDRLIGKVVFSSVLLGKAVRLSSNPLIFIPLILVPLVVILILNLRRVWIAAKELEQESIEQDVASLREELQRLQKEKNDLQNEEKK